MDADDRPEEVVPNVHAHAQQAEQAWQDERGGSLQVRAYGRPGTRVMFQKQFSLVAEALGLEPEQRILDLGCGAGLFLGWLSQRLDARLHGLDLSLGSLRLSRERTPNLNLVAGDAEILPYTDSSFDRVACNGAAHHLPDMPAMLREVHRILVPGGRFVLYEPMTTSYANAVRKLAFRRDRFESPADLDHKHGFDMRALGESLRESGFDRVSVSYHDWLAYPLTGMYVDLPIGRSRGAVSWLLRTEEWLERSARIRTLAQTLAWRILVVGTRPQARAG